MDPTSRRLVARIAIWTGAILVLMAIWFIAIQPRMAQSVDTPGDDVIVPEESSGDEAVPDEKSDAAVEEEAGVSGDRNSEGGAAGDDSGSDDVATPEPEIEEPGQPGSDIGT